MADFERPFDVQPTGQYIVRLGDSSGSQRARSAVIPPLGTGVYIADRTLIVDKEEAVMLSPYAETSFQNMLIAFDLDLQGGGGANSVTNEDNWGIEAGYAASELWRRGGTGRGVKMGVADSGIDANHPAFTALRAEGRLSAFAAFNHDGTKRMQHAPDGGVLADAQATPTLTHWHGTFVSSILVGQETEGKARGMAPDATLAVAQVLQGGNIGSVASITAGLYWLLEQRCDIVSLSLGWPGKHEEWEAPIRALLAQGCVVVSAIGNEFGVPGLEPTRSPANYPIEEPADPRRGVLISVGAHDQAGHVGDFSGGGVVDWSQVVLPQPDGGSRPSSFADTAPRITPLMIAPGVDIISASPNSQYQQQSGTSHATPHVSGLIALVLSLLRLRDPAAAPRTAATLVLDSLVPLRPDVPVDRAGRGRVDVQALLRRVSSA